MSAQYDYRGLNVDGKGALASRAHLSAPRPEVLWRLGREGLTFNRGDTVPVFRDKDAVLQQVQDNDEFRGRHYYRDRHGILRPSALVELSRTNDILNSEDFSAADWGAETGAATITTNDATAPDNTTTADKVEDDNGSGFEDVAQFFSVSDDSLGRVISVFVKKKTSGQTVGTLRLTYRGGDRRNYENNVDVSDGSFSAGKAFGSGGTFIGADVHGPYTLPDGTEWWRVWIAGTNNGTGNTTLEWIYLPALRATINGSIDSSLTGFQHLWGAQLEGLSGGADYPTSYIATGGSAVTRSAEDLSSPFLADPQDKSIYLRFRVTDPLVVTGGRLFQIGADGSEHIQIKESSGNIQLEHDDGTNVRTATITTSWSVGDEVELLAKVEGGSTLTLEESINGGSLSSADSGNTISHPSSYSDQHVYVGRDDASSNITAVEMIEALVANPIQPMSVMRGLAETPPEFGR